MIETARKTIESAIQENDMHLKRLERAKGLLEPLFPLEVEQFESLSEEQIEHIDQFIYRFTKLQDSMGRRLLPALYTWLENDDRPVPFLDMLNRLEQLGILEDVSRWQFYRNLRNNLAHDYPESIEQTVQTLNILFREIDALESLYQRLRQSWMSRMP